MYKNTRYPIMRVDIARIAILHAYGGMYADLDTLPQREWFAQAPLAVCSIQKPPGGWKASYGNLRKRLSAKQGDLGYGGTCGRLGGAKVARVHPRGDREEAVP